ncbi:MAG: alpha-amylase [Oscillospiraceae bacterium]|nr:alpha-amylase [Oscillospiraceae bacterium]
MDYKKLGLVAGDAIMQGHTVAALSFVALAQSEMIDDTTITENADLFCVWDENWTGRRGSIVLEDGVLFRAIHDVGSGQNTRPSTTPSMWTRIGAPGDEWPSWSQPLGAHDAYPLGAQVTHNGQRWTSDINNNVWEPGVFGWSPDERH